MTRASEILASLIAAMFACAIVLGPSFSAAMEPGEALNDPALEARAREIGRELRCLVCQNQSIDDSNAELARDLRRLVRERVSAGENKDQVIAHVVARYGNFVRLKPPMESSTYLLWFGPALVLIAGAFAARLVYRRMRTGAAAAERLDQSERARLDRLLGRE
ncbi:MAG: cytochrome c-type biogenesis protein [Alphaproteobacteria bacterium]